MKFSGKMCFNIILKVTKKTEFHLLFRRYIFRKTTGGAENRGGGGPSNGPHPSCFRVKVHALKFIVNQKTLAFNLFESNP